MREKIKLVYKWTDDETAEIFVDGQYIGYMEHGRDGWAGMEVIKNMLTTIAAVCDWEIEHEGDPAI